MQSSTTHGPDLRKTNFYLCTVFPRHPMDLWRRSLMQLTPESRTPLLGVWGQVEKASTGGIHLQLLIQLKERMTRASAMKEIKKFLGDKSAAASCDVRHVMETPSKAYQYCVDAKKRFCWREGMFNRCGCEGCYWGTGKFPLHEGVDYNANVIIIRENKFGKTPEDDMLDLPEKATRQNNTIDRQLLAAQEFIETEQPSFKDTCLQFPGLLANKEAALRRIFNFCTKPRSERTKGYYVYGDAGSGKTSAVAQLEPNAYWLPQPEGSDVWWPDYDGQEVVVVDEFETIFTPNFVKRLLDFTPMYVAQKHGYSPLRAKRIYFLSNHSPKKTLMGGKKEDGIACMRRLDTILHFYRIENRAYLDTEVNPYAKRSEPLDNYENLGAILDCHINGGDSHVTPQPTQPLSSLDHEILAEVEQHLTDLSNSDSTEPPRKRQRMEHWTDHLADRERWVNDVADRAREFCDGCGLRSEFCSCKPLGETWIDPAISDDGVHL